MHGGRILLIVVAQLAWVGGLVFYLFGPSGGDEDGRTAALAGIAVAALIGIVAAVRIARVRVRSRHPLFAIACWLLGALALLRFVYRMMGDTDAGPPTAASLIAMGALDAALALLLLGAGFALSATTLGRR